MSFGRREDGFGGQSGEDEATRAVSEAATQTEKGAIERAVARFNAEEVAAGYLPSDSLGRFLAILELRDALRRSGASGVVAVDGVARATETAGAPQPKLRRSVVARLFEQGQLLRQHVMAADDIEEVHAAVTRGLFASAARRERVQESRGTADLFDRLNARIQRRLRDTYWPWLVWLRDEPLTVPGPGGNPTLYANPLPLVIDIVVDNCGVRRAERRHRLRNGAASAVLRAALHRYCLLAGYVYLPETAGEEGGRAVSGTRR